MLVWSLFFVGYFSGAWMHEGDIQVACKTHGHSSSAAWRGFLVCSPAEIQAIPQVDGASQIEDMK
jgi:hypothetical protein